MATETQAGRGSLGLANEMFPALREHTQWATLHKGHREVPFGNNVLTSYHSDDEEGGHAKITVRVHRVAYTKVSGLCDREAKELGYKSVEEILIKLGQWDRQFDSSSEVTLIYFS